MPDRDDKPVPPTVAKDGDEPFLKRWSRLKSEEADEAPDGEPGIPDAQSAEGALVEGEVPAIDPADLPDVESLEKDSDYTPFMQEGVPDTLRTMALRKLFASNPGLAVLDGLNEYDEDYSKLGIVTQTVKTAYKVGRGFLEDEDLVEIDEVEDMDDEDEPALAVSDKDGEASDEVTEAAPAEETETAETSGEEDKTVS